jgi:hypothetical protein
MNKFEKLGGRRVTGEQERRINNAVKKGQDAKPCVNAKRKRGVVRVTLHSLVLFKLGSLHENKT